jgi:hypothetical protein
MNEIRTLHLELDGGRVLPVEIRKETTERSPHTGRDLLELHGRATTRELEQHKWIASVLGGIGDRSVHAHDDAGDFAGRWSISWNSYGESAGEHSYTLLLREAEELSLEVLQIDGLELHPYEYREEVIGDGLTICAKVVGTEADVLKLRALMRSQQTLSVTRRGIHPEPREMRLGVGEWSQMEDSVKYRLVLVDRGLESNARTELARFQEERNRAALGFYANFLERLADLMVEKGVVTREELHLVREGARSAPGVARHELWHVPDVDEL